LLAVITIAIKSRCNNKSLQFPFPNFPQTQLNNIIKMFAKTALISTLAGLAAAAPTAAPANEFAMIALHSGNQHVHQAAIAAHEGQLWINEPTTAYCPSQAGGACADSMFPDPPPPCLTNIPSAQNTTTIFAALPNTANSTLSMYVSVPGGQQAYVAPGGAIKYTTPHSGYTPPDSVRTGFEYLPSTTKGGVGKLTFEGLDFWACPPSGSTGYEVFAAGAHGFKVGPECISIILGTAPWDGKTAYEYN
jgi:hypothetical protein